MLNQLLKNNRREAGMFVLLLILVIWTTLKTVEPGVDGLFNSRFLTLDNFKNVSRTIGIFGIFSIGVGIVIITSGIDLSIGSLMALLGILFFYGLTGTSDLVPEMSWPISSMTPFNQLGRSSDSPVARQSSLAASRRRSNSIGSPMFT